MADTTSKGLLPQLVEVLHALADSQALLTSKVRNAYLEHERGTKFELDESLDPRRRPAGARTSQGFSPLCAKPILVPDKAELFTIDNVGSLMEGSELTAPLSTWSQNNGRVDLPVNDSEVLLSGNMPEEVKGQLEDALPSSVPTQNDAPETIHRAIADGLPAHHDYNYFDELDAKLGELRGSESKSEDRDL